MYRVSQSYALGDTITLTFETVRRELVDYGECFDEFGIMLKTETWVDANLQDRAQELYYWASSRWQEVASVSISRGNLRVEYRG